MLIAAAATLGRKVLVALKATSVPYPFQATFWPKGLAEQELGAHKNFLHVLHLQSVVVRYTSGLCKFSWEGLQDTADKHAARAAILSAVNIGVTVEDLERSLLMLDRLECKYNNIADERARIEWDRFLQLRLEKGAKMAHRN